MTLIERYRGTGADLPFGNPLLAHPGVTMEGYYWRITDPDNGRSVIAGIGVNQGPRGSWATLFLGASNGFVVHRAVPGAEAGRDRIVAYSGDLFYGDDQRVTVDLGEDAKLDIRFSHLAPWPRKPFGGSSFYHSVPGLNQYWHPWILGGSVTGTAVVGDDTWEFDNAQIYAEKNWGKEGFPDSWWWGQAQGFADREACLAFAGGDIDAGPYKDTVTALVVRLPNGEVIRLGNPGTSPVHTITELGSWRMSGKNYRWQIDVEAFADPEDALVLPVPLPSEHRNVPGDLEVLNGHLRVVVHDRGKLVWNGESRTAALEVGGLDLAADYLRTRGLTFES